MPRGKRERDEDGADELNVAYQLGEALKRIEQLETDRDKLMELYMDTEKKINSINSNDSVNRLTEAIEKIGEKKPLPQTMFGDDVEEAEKEFREKTKILPVKESSRELHKEIRLILRANGNSMGMEKITTALKAKGILKGVAFIIANNAVKTILLKDPAVQINGSTVTVVEG